MRRLQAFLLMAGLSAAPAGALSAPADTARHESWTETAEWSTSTAPLGLTVMSLSPELRTFFGSRDKSGVLVSHVRPGSPAAKAGIAVGDVIVDVEGTRIHDAGDVLAAAMQAESAHQLRVQVLRSHKVMTFDLEVAGASTSILDQLPALRWWRELFPATGNSSST